MSENTTFKGDQNLIDQLTNQTVIDQLVLCDPKLNEVFETVHESSFDNVYKPPYVALVGAVIGQIIRYQDAKRIRGNLYRKLKNADFTIEQFVNLSDSELSEIGFDNQKIEILKRLNTFILDNQLDLNSVSDLDRLTEIKGIGEWTLQTVKLTSMLDTDIFPSKDVFLRDRVKRLYNLNKRPTTKETEAIAKKWSPYRSVVCWYLWRWF